jgi:hypothetical protein
MMDGLSEGKMKGMTVIGNLILLASHVTTHARQTLMALGRSNTWRFAFMQTWTRFAAT